MARPDGKVIFLTVTVVVFFVAYLCNRVVFGLSTIALVIDLGGCTHSSIQVEVKTWATIIDDTVAIVVDVIPTLFFGVVVVGLLTNTATVCLGVLADTGIEVFVDAGAELFKVSVTVIVHIIAADLGRAVELGLLANTFVVGGG